MDYKFKRDEFFLGTSWEIFEAQNESVDGVKVLSKFRGQCFIVDGSSQNDRYYTRALWEKVLDEHKDRLENGKIYGTIGHDIELNDKAFREGLVSHVYNKLWIDGNKGMGEGYILDTTVGRNLDGYLRGKVCLGSSTRAFGTFEGKTGDNIPIVDENTYKFEGIDFVHETGVIGTEPEILESLKDGAHGDDAQRLTEERYMEVKQLTESLERSIAEKNKVETRLNEVLGDNEGVKGKLAIAEAKIQELNESLKVYKTFGTADGLTESARKLTEVNEALESLKTELTEAKEAQAKFNKLGTYSELEEALHQSEAIGDKLRELGSVEDLTEALDALEEYTALGTIVDVKEALEGSKEHLDGMTDLGTKEELTEALDLLEKYITFGTPEELTEAFDTMENAVGEFQTERIRREANELGDELGIDESVAGKLLKSVKKSEVAEIVEGIRGSRGRGVGSGYRKPGGKLNEDKGKGDKGNKGGGKNKRPASMSFSSESRASRLMESFTE